MSLLDDLPQGRIAGAIVTYLHILAILISVGALALERGLLRPEPGIQRARWLILADGVYGLAALATVLSGILLVLHYGPGMAYYTGNPLFWWKVGGFLAVALLSLGPTVVFLRWITPLREGIPPQLSRTGADRLSWILNLQLGGIAVLPLLATLVTRGVGLNG